MLAWVWQLKRWRLAGGQRPVQPTHLPVPEALDFINEKPTHGNLAAMLRLPANLKSTQWQILAGPILILLILSMMVLPLPAFILDPLFTFNIALSIMVLLVAMFTQRTLEFAAFPTILLFTTLFASRT